MQGEAEPIGVAAALADQVDVGVIEVEEALGDDVRVMTAISALLRLGQKIDGHRGTVSTNDRLPRRPEAPCMSFSEGECTTPLALRPRVHRTSDIRPLRSWVC